MSLVRKMHARTDTRMQTCSDPMIAWIGLSSIPGVGRTTFRKLVERFGTPDAVLGAAQEELEDVEGLSAKVIEGIRSFPWKERAVDEFLRSKQLGAAIIIDSSPSFPANLKQVQDAPVYLYSKGSLLPEDTRAIAIVGTRRPTHYGLAMAQRIASDLAAAKFTIVSGLARGIDTQAHKGALSAGGRTIAVFGSGIDVVYPPENKGLMAAIVRSGAVVTENPLGTQPEGGYFPARNRIISGLSLGTVIIEASEDSGSLITAQYTREQGRPLFAVPGNAGSAVSRGTNNLIRQGAVLVESAQDILRSITPDRMPGMPRAPKQPLPSLSPEEQAVIDHITDEPRHIDRIMQESGTTAGRLSGVLITLELKGLVMQLPGKYYIKED